MSGTSAANNEVAGIIRAAQIDAIMRFTPMACLANAGNAALITYVVFPFADGHLLLAWNLCLLVLCSLGLRAYLKRKKKGPRRAASRRGIHHSIVQAGMLSALWAVVPVAWFHQANPAAQVVVATVVTGMICAGGFALSTIKQAATTYVAVLTAGSLLGLVLSDMPYAAVLMGLLAAYSLFVLRSVFGTAGLFEKQFLAELELRKRGQTIELLLAQFEDKASDWLFELDARGHLTNATHRLVEVSGRSQHELDCADLCRLIEADSGTLLRRTLSQGRAFRDLEVEYRRGNETRWWSLTAEPIIEERKGRTGWRGVGSDITEAKKARDEVSYLAKTDTLTGLANRRHFFEVAEQAFKDAQRSGATLIVGCIDLDKFKQVNDRFGHGAGDRLLQLVSAELKAWASSGTLIGRFGGDEFGALFPSSASLDQAMEQANALSACLARVYLLEGHAVEVSASVGIASASSDVSDIQDLLKRADFALYRAKHGGGATVCLYDPEMHREVKDMERLAEDLSHAAEREELTLEYQPIVDVETGRPVSFEALIRWKHPDKGNIPPALFIPLAERCGQIVRVGEWVLERACRDAATWPGDFIVSVNVSATQICKSQMERTVARALECAALPAHRLELEITEGVFVEDERSSVEFLEAMRAKGVSIALDDFGTGYSSLGYIGRLPISKLKIDRSFVSGGVSIAERAAIAQTIVAMGRSLGMTITAEGVETYGTLEWLKSMGCTYAQGYLFSRSLPGAAVADYLARQEQTAEAEDLAQRLAS